MLRLFSCCFPNQKAYHSLKARPIEKLLPIEKEIGENVFTTTINGKVYAVKQLNFGNLHESESDIDGELLPLTFEGECEQIIKVFKVYTSLNGFISSHTQLATIQFGSRIEQIQMEYNKGFKELIDYFPSKLSQVRKIATNLFKGIDFLHKQGMFHRDIKPDNLLVDENYDKLKILDFGFCKRKDQCTPTNSACGTHVYLDPQIFAMKPTTDKVDIFAAGATLYSVTYDTFAYCRSNSYQEEMKEIYQTFTAFKIKHYTCFLDFHKKKKLKERIITTEAYWTLMNDLMAFEAKDRPTAEKALTYMFLKS